MGRLSALSEQVSELQGAVHQKAERAALQEQESCVRELGEAVQQQAEELAAVASNATCRGNEQAEAMGRLTEDLAAVARGGQCAEPGRMLDCCLLILSWPVRRPDTSCWSTAISVWASQTPCNPSPAA